MNHGGLLPGMIAAVAVWLTGGTAFGGDASAVTIAETRLDGGDSEIRVVGASGDVTATYRINLSTHHHPATDPDDPAIRRWESWKYGAFVCFNSNQFDGREIDTSKDPKIYDPRELDVKQWIAAFKAAGMDHAVLTVRHTSGFLLWDSPTSQHDVASSGNPTDVVKLYTEECRRQGIEPGIYYCLWGGAFNASPNARAIILAQLHELATRYGPIPYFWIDMGNWKPADLSIQEIYDALKNVHPQTVVMFNQHIQDGTHIRYFPTDALDGELRLPPATGHNPFRKVGEVTYYLPFEMNTTSQQRAGRPSWFTYGPGKAFAPSRPYPTATLDATIRLAYARGASHVLLACAPDYTGRMRAADVEQLIELGRMLEAPGPLSLGGKATASGIWPEPHLGPELAFDGNPATRWGGAPDTKSGWLAVDLGEPRTFGRAWLSEGWGRVRKFELQVQKDGRWETIHSGTTIGEDYSATFEPVTAQHVRLNILEATDVPTIWEVQLFAPAK